MYAESIKKRCSVRTFEEGRLSQEMLFKIDQILKDRVPSPFNTYGRFVMVELTQRSKIKLNEIVTYGVIKNPRFFIVGMVSMSGGNLVDLGYSLERIILDLTALGIGTCWLGGTFNQSFFSKYAGAQADEVIPCVIALGLPSCKRSATDKMIRFMARSHQRKSLDKLFFQDDFRQSVVCSNESILNAMEMVRLAPSASNKQPWRILVEDKVVHFYLFRNSGYNKVIDFLDLADLQLIDMGIAMSHWALVWRDQNLLGRFVYLKNMDKFDYTYIGSFIFQ